MIYYEKPYVRAHSFGVKDYLVGKAIDEVLGVDYPYVRVPLKRERNDKVGLTIMELSLLEDHSYWGDGYCETHSFRVNDDYLREAIWDNDQREIIDDGDHSLGVIKNIFIEEETSCKDEQWDFLTMIEEMVASKVTWDPIHQSIIGGNDFLFFILLTNETNDYLLSRYLKDSSKAIVNE